MRREKKVEKGTTMSTMKGREEGVLDGLRVTRTAGGSVAVRERALVRPKAHAREGDVKRHLTHVTRDRRVADLSDSA